jgi:multidrug efflux pump subunit AcrB
VFFATMALTVVMFVQIPKGFFPIQDTGLINGISEAAQDISPQEMMRLQRSSARSSCAIPTCGFGSQTGFDRRPNPATPAASTSSSSRARSAMASARRSSTGCGRNSPQVRA